MMEQTKMEDSPNTKMPLWLQRGGGIAPVDTQPGWHRSAHQENVPKVTSLDGVYRRIEVPGVHGMQHNPSIVVAWDQLVVSVRVMNDGRSLTYLGTLNDGPQLSHASCLANDWRLVGDDKVQLKVGRQTDIEDLRLFLHNGRLHGIGTIHGIGGETLNVRAVLVEIGDDGSHYETAKIIPSHRQEKNWMPVVDGDQLRFIYSIDPELRVVDFAPDMKAPMTRSMGFIRGGSQLIPYRGGWLAIVHEVYKTMTPAAHNPLLGGFPAPAEARPIYVHKFVRFDRNLREAQQSNPFKFRHDGIEFCAGLARWGEGLIASFGISDQEAWVVAFDPEAVEAQFA